MFFNSLIIGSKRIFQLPILTFPLIYQIKTTFKVRNVTKKGETYVFVDFKINHNHHQPNL